MADLYRLKNQQGAAPCCLAMFLSSAFHTSLSFLNTFSLIHQLSRSESPSKVMSSGKPANQNEDWEQALNDSSPASLPEYTGKEPIVVFMISFHI